MGHFFILASRSFVVWRVADHPGPEVIQRFPMIIRGIFAFHPLLQIHLAAQLPGLAAHEWVHLLQLGAIGIPPSQHAPVADDSQSHRFGLTFDLPSGAFDPGLVAGEVEQPENLVLIEDTRLTARPLGLSRSCILRQVAFLYKPIVEYLASASLFRLPLIASIHAGWAMIP
jgi:hypothetical protein